MHTHACRHCENEFVCGIDAAECFSSLVTCDDCFWEYEFVYFAGVLALLVIAAGMTVFLVRNS